MITLTRCEIGMLIGSLDYLADDESHALRNKLVAYADTQPPEGYSLRQIGDGVETEAREHPGTGVPMIEVDEFTVDNEKGSPA